MKVIDYVNGHDEFDGSLWFFDGKYVGHDDQISEYDFAPNGAQAEILFRHRVFVDGVTYDDIEPYIAVRELAEIEHLLKPLDGEEAGGS